MATSGGGNPEEPNPTGYGSTPGGGKTGGPSWATGGIGFDDGEAKKLKKTLDSIGDSVRRIWEPFTDTSKATKGINTVVGNLKKQLQSIKPITFGGLIGGAHTAGAGGAANATLGGSSTMPPVPGPTPELGQAAGAKPTTPGMGRHARHTGVPDILHWHQAVQAGVAGYRDARDQKLNGGGSTLGGTVIGAVGAGVVAGAQQMGAARLTALGTAAVVGAEKYVSSNLAPAVGLQTTANQLILQQSTSARNWSTGYRDSVTSVLSQQGLARTQRGGFVSRNDVAEAASTLASAGLQVTAGGQGTQLSTSMNQAGTLGLLTGTGGVGGAGILAGVRQPGTVNALGMLGIQATPGGTAPNMTAIYQQLRNRIFAPLGHLPTKDDVRNTLATPGTPSYALLQQIFQGDSAQIQAFVNWVSASAPATAGGKTVDVDLSSAQNMAKTSTGKALLGTTQNQLQQQQASTEQRRAAADQGMLEGAETTSKVVTGFNDAVSTVTTQLGGLAQAISGVVGATGQGAGSIPGATGRMSNSLIQSTLEAALGGAAFSKGGSILSKIPGVGSIFSKTAPTEQAILPGLGADTAGLSGLGLLSNLAAAAAPLIGGQLAGGAVSNIGKKGGKQNQIARAGGTLTKYLGAGLTAGIASAGPTAGLSVLGGLGVGLVGGLGHIGLRALGLVGDPVGRMPVWWPTGGVGDPTSDNSSPQMGALSLRGPGKVMGMNSDFVQRLAKMFQDNPQLVLNSGFRTSAEQAALYKANPNIAAPPGSSQHEKGYAADVGPPSQYGWMAQNAAKYGVYIPMPGKEPWHLQPSGGVAGAALSATATAGKAQDGGAPVRTASILGTVGGMTGPNWQGNTGPTFGSPLAGGGAQTAKAATAAVASTSAAGGNAGAGSVAKGSTAPVGSASQQDIMNTILKVGRSIGADPQMLLAAFEAGWDESHMTDLPGGDRDSAGVFQQRPSQGWGTLAQVTDVSYAATSFFKRAAGSKYRGKGTAAQMAQDVQRSAFPTGSNYQAQRGKAVSSLAGLGVDVSGIGDPVTGPGSTVNLAIGKSGGGGNVTIQNATFTAQISRGTPEEAEKFARWVMDILGDRKRIMQIAST